MIQDITPKLNNQYKNIPCEDGDKVFCFAGEEFQGRRDEEGNVELPTAVDLCHADKTSVRNEDMIYLFSIGEEKYFLNREGMVKGLKDFDKLNVRKLREFARTKDCFAAATAFQLFVWYRDNKFCGRCGHHMHHLDDERGLVCPICKMIAYPKIAPAVIVAVTNGDKILLTKYADRSYKKYALIAGFTEIGETVEETVIREVMEEVGLKVKNIRYYKSQPWGTDSNLLMGFFADLDGDDTIRLDTNELAVGEWVAREDMDLKDDGISLTREMMRVFKKGDL